MARSPEDAPAGGVVWRPTPEALAGNALVAFCAKHELADYDALVARADADPAWLWNAVIAATPIRFYKPYERVMDASQGPAWTRWCVGGTTNLVLNCLDARKDDARQAISWEGEAGERRSWTLAELKAETARLAGALRALGLGRGDRIALFLPMVPETAAAFFAVAKIGAIVQPLFSGFGSGALASRLNDAGAAAVITVDGTHRRGKTVAMKATLDEAAKSVPTLRHVVVLRLAGNEVAWSEGRDVWWHDVVRDQPTAAPTEHMPADAPFMLVFTSGTSGKAKGTVHTHCGLVTKLALDFGLLMDFRPGDRMLWMSDIGWVVGAMTLVVTALLGGTVVMAEGAPDYPDPGRLWRVVAEHRVSYLGVAPTIVRSLMRHGVEEVLKHDFSCLRMTVSSGELWNPDSWMWFFEHVCGRRVPILNVSGGTEIGWGIVITTPTHPLKPCAFSGPVPGTGADIVDEKGASVGPGVTGELVMRNPSIGLTRGLWNDDARYIDAYWSRIPGLWVHGDWASRDADGHWYLHGRSDDTIKVAGKRCGPSEVESLLMATGEVAEAAATAVADALKGETVACVCVAKAGGETGALAQRLSEAVVSELGPAFRPSGVYFVSELPKTRNMKVMRRVVRAVIEGRDAGDLASLVNPEAVAELSAAVAGARQASNGGG